MFGVPVLSDVSKTKKAMWLTWLCMVSLYCSPRGPGSNSRLNTVLSGKLFFPSSVQLKPEALGRMRHVYSFWRIGLLART